MSPRVAIRIEAISPVEICAIARSNPASIKPSQKARSGAQQR
ncbi:MAG TPA: hypothetical protein VGE92_14150 [Steroidobacteraceae bacterium]